MAGYIRIAITIFFMFCQSGLLHGQTAALRCVFEVDTVRVNAGQTFSNTLILSNTSGRPLRLFTDAAGTAAKQGLINIPPVIDIGGGERKSFPVKYLANQELLTSVVQSFTIRFRETEGAGSGISATFCVQLDQIAGITLTSSQNEYYLNPQTGLVQLMIQCSNDGVLPAEVRLELTELPEGLDFTLDKSTITLRPGARQLVPVQARNRSGSRQAVDFNVKIDALDLNGKQLASHRIRILNLSSIRRAGLADGPFAKNLNNAAALRYMTISNAASFYQLQANGKIDLSSSDALNYRLNLDYYQQHLQGINLYDTHLDYEGKTWGLKAGNIYENLDYALGGRGVRASLKFGDDRRLSVYGLQNNYMLVSGASPALPGANIAALNYNFLAGDQQQGRLTYLFSDDNYFGQRSHMFSGRTGFRLGNYQQLGLEGGLSNELSDSGNSASGFAGGLSYQFSTQQWQLSSLNYFSSPYFVGLRRGLFQSETRLLHTGTNGAHYGARLSLMTNDPAFQTSRMGFRFLSNRNTINIYELTFGRSAGAFSFDIRPYLLDQRLAGTHYFQPVSTGFNWRSSALRTQVQTGFSLKSHTLNLQTDYGYVFRNTAAGTENRYHSLRLNASYTNNWFGLNGYLQLNPYYLTDALTVISNGRFKIFSIGPNTSFTAFRERLKVQASAQYNDYGASGNKNYSVNGNLRWVLPENWALSADIFYTLIRSGFLSSMTEVALPDARFDTRQFRIGVEKQFAGISHGARKKLELRYFEDKNNNGVAEPGERALSGLTIRANQETAVTNSKGVVKFYNMKAGNYKIEVLNSREWSMQQPLALALGKNKRMDVAVTKTMVLKGRLVMTGKQYLETSPELAGLRVHAADRLGRTFETLTDAGGTYFLHLPEGSYQVSIVAKDLPISIVNARNNVTLEYGNLQQVLDFKFRDERRRIEVVRF
ncbi:SdrD B-like domain-containing protein [Pedobacter sp. SYP-B3415]|uniref:SdrD B-like domain-containing protein n=1 Tax=Pedobacter sp. SYP-B3415 TaxID=2496641 RepID=UPI00101DEF2A|nr:SdrD B-like domain-containing protein [Pedobacter sp. SYP-B3415]